MIAVDTNLLVYAHRSAYPEHKATVCALEDLFQRPEGWGIPLSCLSEFWSLVTHPKMGSRPSSPVEAEDFLSCMLTDGEGMIFSPGIEFAFRLMQMARDLKITGTKMFDLQIVLTAVDNGVKELWTHDKAFLKIPGLRINDPLA